MDKKDFRIVYMGTPDFAVESLRVLVEDGYNVVAVVTMPDKPSGRGHHLQQSPVKQYALSKNIPVLQPERLKDEAFVEELRSYGADLHVVVAFRMLPEVVWTMPRLGTINLHGSLLPQYRGAAPINWAIINGDKQTGVTTFFLKHEIDTGDMILQETMPIGDDEDFGSVHDRMMVMGAKVLLRTVDMIVDGTAPSTPQPVLPAEEMRPAPKIFKEMCGLDFSKTAQEVKNFVRGLSPVPAAWTELAVGEESSVVKIFRVSVSEDGGKLAEQVRLGGRRVATDGKTYLRVECADKWLSIEELQQQGKKRMAIRDFLNGVRLSV